MGGQGSMMHVGSEGWPLWSDPTDELLLLKLLKKLILVLTERCPNTHCIAICCIQGCIAAEQSECPCWPLSTDENATMGTWASKLDHGAMEEGGLIVMNHILFYITWMARCVCVAYLGNKWHQDALWEEGKLAEAVMFSAMFCWETLGAAIHVDVTLTCTTYLSGIPWWLRALSAG